MKFQEFKAYETKNVLSKEIYKKIIFIFHFSIVNCQLKILSLPKISKKSFFIIMDEGPYHSCSKQEYSFL